MKRLILFLIIFFSFVKPAHAIEGCTTFKVTPPMGSIYDDFVALGNGCGNTETGIILTLYKNGPIRSWTLGPNDQGRIVLNFSVTEPGYYVLRVYGADNPTVSLNYTLFSVGADNLKQCGQVVNDPRSDICPPECPMIQVGSGAEGRGFRCGDLPPPPQAWCGTEDDPGALTALGCIPFNTIKLTAESNAFFLAISGPIALLLIARAAFILATSKNEPNKVGEAKESITAVIAGLLMIILAVFILRLLGRGLLGLF